MNTTPAAKRRCACEVMGMGKSIETLHAFRGWEKSLTAAWPADADHPQDEWVIGAIDEEGNKYDVITVDANQYDAPGDSEKIARALIALLAQAFSELQPDNHVEEVRTLVEPAPAQDQRESVEVVAWLREWKASNRGGIDAGLSKTSLDGLRKSLGADAQIVSDEPLMTVTQHERIVTALTRPAQTDQQPEQGEVVEALGSMTCACRTAKGAQP